MSTRYAFTATPDISTVFEADQIIVRDTMTEALICKEWYEASGWSCTKVLPIEEKHYLKEADDASDAGGLDSVRR